MELGDNLLRRALTDGETGLGNRISLRLEAERAVARAERYGFTLGLVTIRCEECDADTLLHLARRLAAAVRRSDVLARTGERELSLLLTHEDAEHAPRVEERLREACEQLRASRGAFPGAEIQTELEAHDYARILSRL
jgi:GGDEF domain-containing protein